MHDSHKPAEDFPSPAPTPRAHVPVPPPPPDDSPVYRPPAPTQPDPLNDSLDEPEPASTPEPEAPTPPSDGSGGALVRVERESTDRDREKASENGWWFIDLDDPDQAPTPEASALIKAATARQYHAIPVEINEKNRTVLVAVEDPDDVHRLDKLRQQIVGYTVRFGYAGRHAISRQIDKMYSATSEAAAISKAAEDARRKKSAADGDGGDLGRVDDGDSMASQVLKLTIEQALRLEASDIHFEPEGNSLVVRVRVDGQLRHIATYPESQARNLMTKIKIDSPGMRSDNFMVPDSGVLQHRTADGTVVDVRVEVSPTVWGTGAVMRLAQNVWRPLDGLGFSEHNETRIRKAIAQSQGALLCVGPTGSGKLLELSTTIPTPTGSTTMGALREGDWVIGGNGLPCRVTDLWPINETPDLYRVKFSDGQEILADGDHQWLVSNHHSRSVPRTEKRAQAIAAYESATRDAAALHALADSWDGPESMTAAELADLLDAHDLSSEFRRTQGRWAFVGSVRAALVSTDCPHQANAHEYPVAVALKSLAIRLEQRFHTAPLAESALSRLTTSEMIAAGLRLNTGHANFAVPVPSALDLPEADLLVDPYVLGASLDFFDDKHIPTAYLRASKGQRLALLQGLMDTDGTIDDNGNCELSHPDKRLVTDALDLIRSLGIRASVSWGHEDADGNHVERKGRHRIHFTTNQRVFRVPHKASLLPETVGETQQWLHITDVEPVLPGDADYGPGRCITVDSPDATYLCGDGYVVTSNTTTLYSVLREKIDPTVKIITAENPVEYKVPNGVYQHHVNVDQGLTFASILRSILREDPDIVLVGEIRDTETAETAVDASMTGHLVLSTLHTNDAPGVVPRLIRMGIEPFLLASSLQCVVGQRLVRRLCPNCRQGVRVDPDVLVEHGFDPDTAPSHLFEANPVGCENCTNGVAGRVPIHEVMLVGNELAEAIADNVPQSEIVRLARAAGMTTMREDGWEKIKQGLTGIDQLNAATNRDLV